MTLENAYYMCLVLLPLLTVAVGYAIIYWRNR